MEPKNDYNLIKKHYGEKMAQLCRDLFPTILEEPGALYEILSQEFAPSRFLYEDIKAAVREEQFKEFILVQFKKRKEKEREKEEPITELTPRELCELAGYDFYECRTVEDVKRFEKYYESDEKLCTFKDIKGRLDRCYIFWLVKKNVDEIKRKNFRTPRREDEYGTSVMSLQFSKDSTNWLSIKNRYNHTVPNPDATYGNDLDKIYPGLGGAFKRRYNLGIDKESSDELSWFDYIKADDGKRYKYNFEDNATYYCPDNILIQFGTVHKYDSSRYILVETYKLDMKEKKIDPMLIPDGFAETIGEIKKIEVINNPIDNTKDIIINDDIIIGINRKNQIIKYINPHVTVIGDGVLRQNRALKTLELPNVERIGFGFLRKNNELQEFYLPKVKEIGEDCLAENSQLTKINCPNLEKIENDFACESCIISEVNLPKVKHIGSYFLSNAVKLKELSLPSLEFIGTNALDYNTNLSKLYMPKVEFIGNNFLRNNTTLEKISLPEVLHIGDNFMSSHDVNIREIYMPKVIEIGAWFLRNAKKIEKIDLSSVVHISDCCLSSAGEDIARDKKISINLPNVKTIGECFLGNSKNVTHIELPKLTEIGICFLAGNNSLKELYLPNLESMDIGALKNNKNIEKLDIPNLDTPSYRKLAPHLKQIVQRKPLKDRITEHFKELISKGEKLKLKRTKVTRNDGIKTR